MNKELYRELKRYYREVNICKLCGNLYGSDIYKEKGKICPTCLHNLKWKKE